MGAKTKISWTDATWNPVVGCTPVSAGCQNCYAKRMHERFMDTPFSRIWLNTGALEQPLYWRRSRRIFVCSMSDLFHEDLPNEFREKVFDVIRKAHWHTFQILTKRPGQAIKYWKWRKEVYLAPNMNSAWPDNCWFGVTVENQKAAEERIDLALEIPAPVHYVSVEPMLGLIDLFPWLGPYGPPGSLQAPAMLDWVICGGESGPRSRPMHPDWPRSLRDQCQRADVPFHFKQWGEWSDGRDSYFARDALNEKVVHWEHSVSVRVGKKVAGRLLDGKEWLEFPEVNKLRNIT